MNYESKVIIRESKTECGLERNGTVYLNKFGKVSFLHNFTEGNGDYLVVTIPEVGVFISFDPLEKLEEAITFFLSNYMPSCWQATACFSKHAVSTQ